MWNIFKFNQETSNDLASIKKLLIASMNGVASTNMKHLGYKLNYGVSLLRIKELSTRFKKSEELADCLWKSDCREMKIMATLLHPEESFDEKKAYKWSLDCSNMELAEQFSRNIAAKRSFASSIVCKLLEGKEKMNHSLAYILAAAADKEKPINDKDFSIIFQNAEKDIYSEEAAVYSSVARFLKQASTRDLERTSQLIDKIDLEKGPGCAWIREEVRTFIEYAPSK
ncbi:MAG: DNA alkylation repair protein [Paludibacteraceae bacterium]|nr:DNA alkylation repair protein [Paludibacteraceae bacterium]